MTLFTEREKHVILFLVCTLILGYGVKLYQGSHLYDDFKPVTSIEKEPRHLLGLWVSRSPHRCAQSLMMERLSLTLGFQMVETLSMDG